MRKISALAICMAICIVRAIPAYCGGNPSPSAETSEVSVQPFRPAPEPFWAAQGRLTYGFQLAYGLENSIPHDISHIDMVMAEPEIGMIAWNSPHSRLPIRRFELVGAGILGGSFHPGGEIFGTSLLLQFGLPPMGRVVPFFDAGSGPVHTTIDSRAPELTGNTQFLSQGGVGFQYFIKPQHAVVFEYHYFHMSNAGLQEPNPGFNGGMVTIGFCWLGGHSPSMLASSERRRIHFPHFW